VKGTSRTKTKGRFSLRVVVHVEDKKSNLTFDIEYTNAFKSLFTTDELIEGAIQEAMKEVKKQLWDSFAV